MKTSPSIYTRMLTLHAYLNKENKSLTSTLNTTKYDLLKQWSIHNGCLFSHNILFPIAYGPYGYIGVKSNQHINDNEAVIYIPKKQMILSKEIQDEYLFVYDKLIEKEDKTNIILILYLIDEASKGDDSFYKPYIDLFPDVDFIIKWDNTYLRLLDDDNIVSSIQRMYNDIINEYNTIIRNSKYVELSLDKFIFFYSQVQSRQFYIDDTCTALVPLADLFNHDNVNMRFEFYDSENCVFKHTESLCGKNKEDVQITKASVYPCNHVTYNTTDEITFPIDNIVNDNLSVDINEHDYFVFATSNGQEFKQGEQCYIKYSKLSNKNMLMHYGFNMLINEDDNTIIYINVDNSNKEFVKCIKKYFIKHYKENKLKIKVKCRNVCEKLMQYYRIMYFYRNNIPLNEVNAYVFNRKVELSVLKECIDLLKNKLIDMNGRYDVEKDLMCLEREMIKNGFNIMDYKMVNVIIYRIRQRVNLAHQIEMMECIKRELERKVDAKDYLSLMDEIVMLENVSEYDSNEYSVLKIMSFIKRQKIFYEV